MIPCIELTDGFLVHHEELDSSRGIFVKIHGRSNAQRRVIIIPGWRSIPETRLRRIIMAGPDGGRLLDYIQKVPAGKWITAAQRVDWEPNVRVDLYLWPSHKNGFRNMVGHKIPILHDFDGAVNYLRFAVEELVNHMAHDRDYEISLIGHSLGGHIALATAEAIGRQGGQPLASLIAFAPAIDFTQLNTLYAQLGTHSNPIVFFSSKDRALGTYHWARKRESPVLGKHGGLDTDMTGIHFISFDSLISIKGIPKDIHNRYVDHFHQIIPEVMSSFIGGGSNDKG